MTAAAATNEAAVDAPVTHAGGIWSLLAWLIPLPVLGTLLFGSAGRDDVYITYWASEQLRLHGRITNYNGETLEQSSSLLHVLLLTAATLITRLPITTIGPWLAVLAGAACAPVAYQLCGRFDDRGRWIAAALVATLPPLVYWSFGGLETSIATLLVLVALMLVANVAEGSSPSKLGLGFALAGVLLVRPEMGPVFVVALLLAVAAVRFLVAESWRGEDGSDRVAAARRIALTAAGVAGGAILIALFRKAYFGDWFPRPVSVKTGAVNIGDGLVYTLETVAQSLTVIAIVVGAVLLVIQRKTLTPRWYLAAALVIVGTGAVIEPGGDWMEGGRLLTPWLAVALVLVAGALGRLTYSRRRAVAWVLIGANVVGLAVYVTGYSTGVGAWTHVKSNTLAISATAARTKTTPGYWERRNAVHIRDTLFVEQAAPIFDALGRAVGRRPVTYASAQAGMVLYYLEKNAARTRQPFVFIDRDGLVDDTWDRCRGDIRAQSYGKPIPWRRVLAGKCGPLPDLVSDVTSEEQMRADLIKMEPYYSRVAVEDATLEPAVGPGPRNRSLQWLAIRNDLLPKLGGELERAGTATK